MSGMFNIKNLSDFLSENVDPDLYPRAFVMSRNGKLIAYSTPYHVSQVKAEAAVVAMAWKSNATTEKTSKSSSGSVTIRTGSYNILARSIQSNLLLVLVGCSDELASDPAFLISHGAPKSAAGENVYEGSSPQVGNHDIALVQRHKLDNMTDTILAEAKFLEMPEDGQYGLSLH